jgi:hypothetical protein
LGVKLTELRKEVRSGNNRPHQIGRPLHEHSGEES